MAGGAKIAALAGEGKKISGPHVLLPPL